MGLLVNPTNPRLADTLSRDVQAAARGLGLQLYILNASTEHDFEMVLSQLLELRAGGLVIGPDAFFVSRIDQVAALMLCHAIPTIYSRREFAAAGGLMSYGIILQTSTISSVSTLDGFSRGRSRLTSPSCNPRRSS
jgi:putative ABC transport system substrate-binding protein